MTADDFARALAERLAEVLPPGFSVRVGQSNVWLESPDGFGVGVGLDDLDDAEVDPYGVDPYAGAAWSVLSSIQDCVSRTIRAPWPSADGQPTRMAMPGARRDGGVLHVWFGDEAAPVIRFRPIESLD